MASLKGGTSLWSAATLGGAAKSTNAAIGPGPWACVYIKNTSAVALTFKIQVAGVANPMAGRNAINDGAGADGGLDWFDYIPAGETSVLSIACAGTSDVAQDISPFSPELMRLVRTDAGGSANAVTAFITCFGPN